MELFQALRIMVVDDQKESRLFLRSALNELGIRNIVEAEDVKHATRMLESSAEEINMILCDWNMPGISGIDFLLQIRGKGREIPFLIVSGRSDLDSVSIAKSTGVDGYIRKPFSPNQIEAKLRIALHRIQTP